MDAPVVPLQMAAELHRDAMRRGHSYGKTEFQQRAVALLADLSNNGPFDQNVITGIKIAMRAVKDLKID